MLKKRGMLMLSVLLFAGIPQAKAASASEVGYAVANYIPNLLFDLLDVFKLNISAGKGAGADVRLTRALELGMSKYDVTRFGLNGGESLVIEESIDDAGFAIAAITIGKLDRDAYEIGATLHALGGAEVAANVRSALDFITGILFIDLEEDNRNIL